MSLYKNLINQKPEGPIYHYTSLEGIISILSNKCTWATRIQYLNDESEFMHAISLLLTSLPKSQEVTKQSIKKYIEKIKFRLDDVANLNLFVLSFSENGDLLSQWRGYCPPGRGYSIGFNYDHLEVQMAKQGFNLRRCIYNKQEKLELINEHISQYMISENDDYNYSDKELDDLAQIFVKQFILFAPLLKHHSFLEEKEWRLISDLFPQDHKQIKYRPGKSMIVPYFEFYLTEKDENLNCYSIIIGPTPHNSIAINSTRYFIKAHGINTIKDVSVSEIPYRDW